MKTSKNVDKQRIMKISKEVAKRRIIREIFSEFDFEKVHAYMVLTGWKWGEAIPTLEKIKEVAEGLISDLLDKPKSVYIRTGGFSAERDSEEVELFFSIEFSGSQL